MSNHHSAEQSIECSVVESDKPGSWIKVGGDPDSCALEYSSGTLRFDAYGVPVQPTKYVGDVNAASKFVDNHVELATVSAPKFGTRVLGVCVKTGLVPSSP